MAVRRALDGRFEERHGFLLARMLAHVTDLEADIDAIQQRTDEAICPSRRRSSFLKSSDRPPHND